MTGPLLDRATQHLLAMKVLAGRRRDAQDISILVRRLGLSSVEQVLALCADVFPDEPVPGRARLILEDVLAGRADRPYPGDGPVDGA